MQVDRRNFEQIFPTILEKLQNCTFLAIDAEFSGLQPPPSREAALRSLFDSAERRYKKAKECSCYFIPQFGVSFFRQRGQSNHWDADCYNFYLYPASFEDFGCDENVIWEISSIQFLKDFKFDFDLLLAHGIPFMNSRRAAEFQKYLASREQEQNGAEGGDSTLLDTQRGFSRFIAAIIESRKPVIGHNMYTDLILLYQHFIDDLPETYQKFKLKLRNVLPQIYDTKVIALGIKKLVSARQANEDLSYLTNTSLYSLYKNTTDPCGHTKPQICLSSCAESYKEALSKGKGEDLELVSTAKCHEAGFDAYVTGSVFIHLGYVLWQHELANKILPQTQSFGDIFYLFQAWINMVNLSRARIPYMNFGGKDPKSHRPPLILIHGYSKAAMSGEINLKLVIRRLSQFGGCEGVYSGDGKRQALIACTNEKTFELAMKHMKQSGHTVSTIRIPGDDNMEPIIPWKKIIPYVASAWTVGLLALWKTGAV